MKKIINIIGKTYSYLTVISGPEIRNKNRTYWICFCKCGNTKAILGQNLKNGSTKSCGCRPKNNQLLSLKNKERALPPEMLVLNRVFKTYKECANKKKRCFSLTKEQVKQLIFSNCYYCNSEPEKRNRKSGKTKLITPFHGIDRLNSKLGYEMSNCVTCCKVCNYMKHEMTEEEFYLHIFKLVKNLRNKISSLAF